MRRIFLQNFLGRNIYSCKVVTRVTKIIDMNRFTTNNDWLNEVEKFKKLKNWFFAL